ncbi:MAG: hypothetical protein LBE36_12155 [Flavobacteriaceae bacterium]|jgi:hypothetical protein|nr:hypothetical protein [Flavobacteriaceae bacterium]
MKLRTLKVSVAAFTMLAGWTYAQDSIRESMTIREYMAPEKYQRNIFEDPKIDAPEYDGIKVTVGGDFSLQFQALDHETKNKNLGTVTVQDNSTTPPTPTVVPNSLRVLGHDFNLPTANLDVNAYLAKGVKLHLRTYLSARHHNEAWVKGGYIQIDNLDFISPGFMGEIMKHARLRFGMDDLNYGDAHFRRSDNAYALSNPFMENNIMDSFTTQPYAEVYGFFNGFMGMVGVTNGKLNQSVVNTATSDNKMSIYAKVGYDKQVNSDLRVRLTGSAMKTNGLTTNGNLYGAERAGSKYYYVLLTEADLVGADNPVTGRFVPTFRDMFAAQINPFIKYHGLEFFGTMEYATGYTVSALRGVPPQPTVKNSDGKGYYTQVAAELLYRFGGKEQFYFGGKYNNVSGKQSKNALIRDINRWNIDAGYYMTKNILVKAEYVHQHYINNDSWGATSALKGGKFEGLVLEATIGF